MRLKKKPCIQSSVDLLNILAWLDLSHREGLHWAVLSRGITWTELYPQKGHFSINVEDAFEKNRSRAGRPVRRLSSQSRWAILRACGEKQSRQIWGDHGEMRYGDLLDWGHEQERELRITPGCGLAYCSVLPKWSLSYRYDPQVETSEPTCRCFSVTMDTCPAYESIHVGLLPRADDS